MKQLIHSLDLGDLSVEDVPAPQPNEIFVLVQNTHSAVSPGTETNLIEFGKSGWLERAKNHPEHVQKTFEKIGKVGIPETMKAIKHRLEKPMPLGYSSAGLVVDPGNSLLPKKQRVAAISPHASFALVGSNFVCPLPENVPNKVGAFTALGCVALHAVREVSPSIGERIAVIGLGVLGQITMQLLSANGCKVYGIEPMARRRKIGEELGFEVAKKDVTLGESSFDAVIIAASSRDASTIQAASRLCKKRGRIVLLGTADIQISRRAFFEKELSFCVSRSMGAGRYDFDFSIGAKESADEGRWDVQKNMQTFLNLISQGAVNLDPLIDVEYDIQHAPKAYAKLATKSPPLGVLLTYPLKENEKKKSVKTFKHEKINKPKVSLIGAGNFVYSTLAPALEGIAIQRDRVVSLHGLNAKILADKYGFSKAESGSECVFNSDSDAIIIATQHDSHAELAVASLRSGKHTFIEKPIATSFKGLEKISRALEEAKLTHSKNIILGVGFNRRFAPAIVEAKACLNEMSSTHKRTFVYTVNAPELPTDHWLLDPKRGGGVFIGEACHFIDLLGFLSDSKVVDFHFLRSDETNASLNLKYENGDIASIVYTTRGTTKRAKEKLEIFVNASVLEIEDCLKFSLLSNQDSLFDRLRSRPSVHKSKGHAELLRAFFSAVEKDGEAPIPLASIFETHRIALEWQKGV